MRKRGGGLPTQSEGHNPCITCLANQSAHWFADLGMFTQLTLSIDLALTLSFATMVSILHEKFVPLKWLITATTSDSTDTFRTFPELQVWHLPRWLFNGVSRNLKCRPPHICPIWLRAMIPIPLGREVDHHVASQLTLMISSSGFSHSRGLVVISDLVLCLEVAIISS